MGAQEDLAHLTEYVNRLFDDDDTEGKEKYVNSHMERLGHKKVTSWTDGGDESKSDSSSGFFGSPRKSREVGTPRGRQKASGSGWPYE
jgi:hypothetical protein